MFNPFKKVQARNRKHVRKATTQAIVQIIGGTPAKPLKAKARPNSKVTTNGAGRALSLVGPTKSKKVIESKGKYQPASATARSRMPVPRGASFQSHVHECAFGNRDYKLYLPACAVRTLHPLPVLMMLHGCGQTPEDFAKGTGMNALAEELGFIVIYPAQARAEHHNRCWNWYRRSDQSRLSGEPALLASLTRYVLASRPADPARIYVAGLSAGASMALILAAAYPDIFAAVGAHSGLAVGAAHDGVGAVFAMKHGSPGDRSPRPMPTINFHGEDDKVVNISNGRYVAARATDAFKELQRFETKGRAGEGHTFVRVSHRRGQGRSFTEFWAVTGSGHAWSGGSPAGRFTDPSGPDASRAMLRFMLQHRTTQKQRRNT